jgi:transposase
MKKLREILRLKLKTKLSMRAIQGVIKQATALQLTWERVQSLNEKQLTELFYPAQKTLPETFYELPDWSEVHRELSRKGMTKQLLWEEYAEQHTDGYYSYSRYCRLYNAWAKKQKRSMRQVHKAGEKCFVDYAGQTVPIVSEATG